MNIIPFSFQFEGQHYNALARVKQAILKTDYFITVMNGELETRLFGNHVLTEDTDGNLLIGSIANPFINGLKNAIAKALKVKLQNIELCD